MSLTLSLTHFQIAETSPQFSNESFIIQLAAQIDQLRGKELPGFMSSQAFYICMSQYIEQWSAPMLALIDDVRQVTLLVCAELADKLLPQFPGIQESLRRETQRILIASSTDAVNKLKESVHREQDPFTLNAYLEERVNRVRGEAFAQAVQEAVAASTSSSTATIGEVKQQIFKSLSDWYSATHAGESFASSKYRMYFLTRGDSVRKVQCSRYECDYGSLLGAIYAEIHRQQLHGDRQGDVREVTLLAARCDVCFPH